MKGFATIDYVVVVGYLVTIAAIGSSFYRRGSTAKDYFLGGRTMSWLPAGISIIAADLSAITVMGAPAWSYKHNLELFWVCVGYPLMAPVVILVFVPFYTRLNLFTAYEYLEKRFNLPVRLVTTALFQILRCSHVAITIYAPSLVIHLVTDLPVWQCILFMGGFTTLYTTLGGMRAVIWTDVIQFCTVTSGLVFVFLTALDYVPGGVVAASRTALDAGRLDILNLSTDPKELTSFWACVVGGSVLSLSAMTTDQAILQRLFTTKSARDCRQSVILQATFVVPVALLLYLVGTALFVFYQHNPSHLTGLGNDDAILPFFAVRELPAGITGLVIAAIFAASMAVMSAGINSLTTATTVDIYQRVFCLSAKAEHYAAVGRLGTACWGTVVTSLALFAKHLGELVNAYNRINSFIAGPLLGIFLLGTLTKRTTSCGALIGALAGTFVAAWITLKTEWSFFYRGPVGVFATFAVGYFSSFFMKPPPHQKIRGLVMGQSPGGDLVRGTETLGTHRNT